MLGALLAAAVAIAAFVLALNNSLDVKLAAMLIALGVARLI